MTRPEQTVTQGPADVTATQRFPLAGFPPTDRLRRRSEFRQVQSRGRRHHTSHFVLLVLHGDDPRRRIGITVTKKVSPSAVKRNRVKRMVREVFRRHRDRFPSASLVVVAKRGADELVYANVANELLAASRSAGKGERGARGRQRPSDSGGGSGR